MDLSNIARVFLPLWRPDDPGFLIPYGPYDVCSHLMLCYIVADLDSPFSGFFRIDISIIVDVIYRLEVMYKMAAMGFEETVCYPDSSRFTQKKYDDTDSLETSLNVKNFC